MKLAANVVAAVVLLASPLGALAQQASPQTPQGAQAGVQIEANSLIGSPVRGQDGKDLGKVSKLMIDPSDGRVTTVIISSGGTLGMGGKELAMPWSAMKLARDQDARVVVTVQQPMMEQAPSARDQERQRNGGSASPGSSNPGSPPSQPRQ
jgi:sporulation protein YlmC with PRC-barrel domain